MRVLAIFSMTVFLGCGGPQKAGAGGDPVVAQCKGSIDTLIRTPPTPPVHGLNGVWRCRYNSPEGKGITEKLTFAISGNKLTVSGTNNYGENVVADGTAGGSEVGVREHETSGRHLRLVSGMLDGHVRYLSYGNCYDTRITCTRS